MRDRDGVAADTRAQRRGATGGRCSVAWWRAIDSSWAVSARPCMLDRRRRQEVDRVSCPTAMPFVIEGSWRNRHAGATLWRSAGSMRLSGKGYNRRSSQMASNNRRCGWVVCLVALCGPAACRSELRCDPPLIKARDSNQCLFECGTRERPANENCYSRDSGMTIEASVVDAGLDGRVEDVTDEQHCEPPQNRCGDQCTMLANDPENCGSCGRSCGTVAHGRAVCSSSVCAIECETGFVSSDGQCEVPTARLVAPLRAC
jgi:hypothetical protein